MKLTLDGTIEQPSKAPLIVECDKVSLLSDYTSGSKVGSCVANFVQCPFRRMVMQATTRANRTCL